MEVSLWRFTGETRHFVSTPSGVSEKNAVYNQNLVQSGQFQVDLQLEVVDCAEINAECTELSRVCFFQPG